MARVALLLHLLALLLAQFTLVETNRTLHYDEIGIVIVFCQLATLIAPLSSRRRRRPRRLTGQCRHCILQWFDNGSPMRMPIRISGRAKSLFNVVWLIAHLVQSQLQS